MVYSGMDAKTGSNRALAAAGSIQERLHLQRVCNWRPLMKGPQCMTYRSVSMSFSCHTIRIKTDDRGVGIPGNAPQRNEESFWVCDIKSRSPYPV
jgi:hypothetical protein